MEKNDLVEPEGDTVDLEEGELRIVQQHKEKMDREVMKLGALRRQHLKAESAALIAVEKEEREFLAYLHIVAAGKGIDSKAEGVTWSFDPATCKFHKLK